MKLSAPKKNTWWIALVLGGAGLLSHFVSIPYVSAWNFWIMTAAAALILLSTAVKNL